MTASRRQAAQRSERGSVLVEAALVLPLVILFMLGAVDLGMWVFQTTQAGSAARSGARVGILHYRLADQTGSTDEASIRNAVARDAATDAVVSVVIRCVGPGSTTVLPGGCSSASVVSPDRIMIKVSWDRPSLTFLTMPFGATQTVNASAVMAINGLPPGVAP